MNDQSIASRLLIADVRISNTLNYPGILEKVTEYGYNREKMLEGAALQKDAAEKHMIKEKEVGDKVKATDDLDKSKIAADKVYKKHLQIARIVFEEDVDIQKALMLNGRRNSTYDKWMQQVDVFYTQALADPEIVARLSEHGLNEEKLKHGLQLYEKVVQDFKKRLKEIGEAQDATGVRDEAIEKMESWVRKYTAFARIALEDTPQYLEILGIVEPS